MFEKYGDVKKYYQTRMYAYQRELEGFEIGGCRVNHLDRKGNNLQIGDKNCLRLTGQIDYIYTPYKKEDVEDYLINSVVPVCKEISEYYKVDNYNKLSYIHRNRIISGVSSDLLISECSEKSGTMHTARFAYKQHRRIFCLNNNSSGVEKILKSNYANIYNNIKSLL